jgi:hypothetical protein
MLRLRTLLILGVVLATPACVIEDGSRRSKHDQADYSSNEPAPSGDGGRDEPEPEPDRPRNRDRAEAEPRNDPPREDKPYVGGYQSRYSHLPDMGETKKYVRAHGSRAAFDRGYYNGEMKVNGMGLIKNGAGKGETVIDGDVEIEGENWKFTGMTFTGDVKIRGKNIDISDCEVFGRVDVRGMGNKTP